MTYQTLLVEIEDHIATLTLNRPRVLNALNAQLLRELSAALDELRDNHEVRAVLITGAGEKAFAAGADIQELSALNAADGQQLALRGQRVFTKIEQLGKPVIACINGFALGGGCELAMACTFRIASQAARLGQPEVKLGLIPGYGGTQRLPRLIGHGAALRLILTGEMVTAEGALSLGLVEEVVPPDQLMPRARQIAQTIASMAPLAVAHAIAAVYEGADLPLDRALAHEASRFGLCCATADKAEGTAAFLAKRPATWTGK